MTNGAEWLAWLSENRDGLLVVGGFVGFVALIVLWAAVIAPRRVLRLFTRLETQGWRAVAPEDASLLRAMEILWPVAPSGCIGASGAGSEGVVVRALVRTGRNGARFLVQVKTQQRTEDGLSSSFETLVLEPRPLSLAAPMYVLARPYSLRPGRPRPSEDVIEVPQSEHTASDGQDFASMYAVLAHPGDPAVRLSAGLRKALWASADAFVPQRGPIARRLPNACMRLTPSGWGLAVPLLTEAASMESLLETADHLSAALDQA